ncbi:hypothetical protein [Stieleria maiorica]|uniref:hypothetical protein n=1 Tax=Stieleria maiorica TaxID=2795974 RepID=UPI0011CAF914|nr:hypothetical protein [Stieleria maiorica]
MVLIIVCRPAIAAPVSFLPIAEAHIIDSDGNGVFETIFDDPSFALSIRRFDGTVQDRTVIEYDLSSISGDVHVTSARLDFRVTAIPLAGSGAVSIGGYAGNGTIELADAANPVLAIGSYDAMTEGLGLTSVNLDPAFFQNQLAGTAPIGLRLESAVNEVNTSISQSSPAPTLVLDVVAVPEPCLLGLLTIFIAGCSLSRRSRTAT